MCAVRVCSIQSLDPTFIIPPDLNTSSISFRSQISNSLPFPLPLPLLAETLTAAAAAMGGSHSREDLDLSDSEDDDSASHASDASSDFATPPPSSSAKPSAAKSSAAAATPASIDAIDRHLRSLHLKYAEPISPNPSPSPTSAAAPAALNAVKLYLHIGGSSPSARWIISDRLAAASFVRAGDDDDDDAPSSGPWCLVVGSKIRARVGPELQLKTFPAQRRVDFVADGVWALKFLHADGYPNFYAKYQSCLFENSYGVAATDEGRAKVFGKDFAAWARPEDGDESIWEDATDGFAPSPSRSPMPSRSPILKPLMEDLREYEEPVEEGGGIQSLALGALDNSFLVGDSGIQVVRNFEHGIHGKGVSVKFSGGSTNFSTPKKALLMRAETNMLLMSPATDGKPHAKGVHQLDIETGKVVSEWKFGKDGADINMRDITNDSKGAQMDPSESTFLGLDDNRLCRWDMRDRRGIVQNIASATESPVLQWTQGHQFSRGTNFQCFASTGDGSIVVGSLDGKIRLYSKSSMRMAKTAFPGLGSPITHVDVTYDGKWILGTTDTYLILICTIFIDKDGKEKTGFGGRMGNRIAAPRLLKLTPLDSHLAGQNNIFREGRFSWVSIAFHFISIYFFVH